MMADFPNALDALLGLPVVQAEGVDLARRNRINFTGDLVVAVVNGEVIDVTIADPGTTAWKAPVRVARDTNFDGTLVTLAAGSTLTANANGALADIDGETMLVGDSVLLISQTDETQNGIYLVEDLGSASTPAVFRRRSDARATDQFQDGMSVRVAAGATYAGRVFVATLTAPFAIDAMPVVFAADASGGGGDATSLQGVNLDAATVGAPGDGDVVIFDSGSGEWIAAPPPGAGSITAPSNPGDDGKIPVASGGDFTYTLSPTLATLNLTNDLTFTQANTAPVIAQADETGNGVPGDTLTLRAQNATGTAAAGGSLTLQSGTGTSTAGRVAIWVGPNFSTSFEADGSIACGETPATTGQFRVPKDWILRGRDDADGADVTLLDWGSAVDELVIGEDVGLARMVYRSLENHDFYSAGALQVRIDSGLVSVFAEGIVFGETVPAPTIGQFQVTSGSGQALTIAAQTTTDNDDGGDLTLQSGAGGASDGNVVIATGSTTRVTVHPSELGLDLPAILFGSSVAAPTIRQTLDGTPSATGQTLTIAAQNATGATSTGGALELSSGTGTTVAGNVEIQTGGTAQLTIAPTLITAAQPLAFPTANPAASTGTIRLAKDNTILMRNDANSADNPVLSYSGASNILQIGPQVAGGPGMSIGGNTLVQFFVSGALRATLSATGLQGASTFNFIQFTGSVANQFIGAQNTSGTPANLTIGAAGKASGTGSGADLILRGGRFSTSGTGGAVRIQYNPDDASPVTRFEANSTGIGFFAATPVAQPSAYTPTNVTPDRAFDADTVAVAELADVVGTLIADLQAYGLLQ